VDEAKRKGGAMPLRYADCYNEDISAVLEAIEACCEDGAEFVVVDHLHAIQSSPRRGQTTADVVCENVRRIAHATRRHGAVLALGAQLGRPEKSNRFAEPTMFDFRDTSQIENTADVMLLTWKENDQSNATIYGKVGKLKEETARPRFKIDFANNGALFDLIEYEPPQYEPAGNGKAFSSRGKS
jgi:hypothetical protein